MTYFLTSAYLSFLDIILFISHILQCLDLVEICRNKDKKIYPHYTKTNDTLFVFTFPDSVGFVSMMRVFEFSFHAILQISFTVDLLGPKEIKKNHFKYFFLFSYIFSVFTILGILNSKCYFTITLKSINTASTLI